MLKEIAFAFDLEKYNESSLVKAQKWLNEIGINDSLYNKPLSCYQDKKITSVLSCIARKKPILVLDEPTLYLSTRDILIILEALKIYLKTLLSQRYLNKVNWLPIGTSGIGMRPDVRACKIGVFSKSVTLKICKIV